MQTLLSSNAQIYKNTELFMHVIKFLCQSHALVGGGGLFKE